MAIEYWKADDTSGIPEILKGLLGHHPDLILVEGEIAVVFREKATKRGGRVVLGNAKKAPGLLGVLGETPYKFVLEIAADEWSGLTNKEKTALVDHMLCACGVEENPQTGNMKCFIRSPDVAYFWDELDRHGDWRPRGDGDEHPMAGKIAELFSTN
jgi:hypothetical protein